MAPRSSASVPECLALETRDQILSPRLRSPRVCREVADRRASLGWRVVFRPVHELCDAVPPCRGLEYIVKCALPTRWSAACSTC